MVEQEKARGSLSFERSDFRNNSRSHAFVAQQRQDDLALEK